MDFRAAACDNGGMTEHKTFPGKVYTVSCAEDTTVVLPDPLGVKEAVVLECTARQQLHVTATAGRLETSSDQAIVTELFKLAPRLKLTLLQSVAGGVLPRGFTELEYLESSGTQYIDTGIYLDTSSRLDITGANTATNNNNINVCGSSSPYEENNHFYFTIYCKPTNHRNVAWYCVGEVSGMYLLDKPGLFDTSVLHTYSLDNKRFAVDGETIVEINATPFVNTTTSSYLLARNGKLFGTFVGRVASAVFYKNGEIIGDFVPVLDANGVPCMFNRVTKACFYNAGTGSFGYRIKRTGETSAPMSLRDPYYTAPSGVYTRKVGENELEVLADTEETTGEGWEWFANTGEAYEYYGIVQEDELLT